MYKRAAHSAFDVVPGHHHLRHIRGTLAVSTTTAPIHRDALLYNKAILINGSKVGNSSPFVITDALCCLCCLWNRRLWAALV